MNFRSISPKSWLQSFQAQCRRPQWAVVAATQCQWVAQCSTSSTASTRSFRHRQASTVDRTTYSCLVSWWRPPINSGASPSRSRLSISTLSLFPMSSVDAAPVSIVVCSSVNRLRLPLLPPPLRSTIRRLSGSPTFSRIEANRTLLLSSLVRPLSKVGDYFEILFK